MTSVAIKQQVPATGALPVAPPYTLRGAADVVPMNPDPNDVGMLQPVERGVVLDSFPVVKAGRWVEDASCAPHYIPGGGALGDATAVKGTGSYGVPVAFNTLAIEFAMSCTAAQAAVPSNFARLQDRVRRMHVALETEAMEREFYGGAAAAAAGVDQPHLTSDLATTIPTAIDYYPLGNTATRCDVVLAELENAIAEKYGRGGGMIHCTPGFISLLLARGLNAVGIDNVGGKLRTALGTLIVPGYGYVKAGNPEKGSTTAAGASQEWVWATSLVEIRQGALEDQQENIFQSMDRSVNRVLFRTERSVLISWDAQFKAGIRCDRTL